MNRRQFLTTSLAATGCLPVSVVASNPLAAATPPAEESRVAILPVDTGRFVSTIDKRIYGHFLEHINHSVVDGLFAEQFRGCGFEGEDFKTYWEPLAEGGGVDRESVVE